MKKITKDVVTKQTVYVSVDGREFPNEADCRAWETSYQGTLEASWKEIRKEQVDTSRIGMPYVYEDYECYVIKPKNIEEITIINAYIKATTSNDAITLTASHINKLVALNFGYDHDYCDVHVLADRLADTTKYIAELESTMSEDKE